MAVLIETQTCSIFNSFKVLILKDIPVSYNWNWQGWHNIRNLIPLSRISWSVFNFSVVSKRTNIRETSCKRAYSVLKAPRGGEFRGRELTQKNNKKMICIQKIKLEQRKKWNIYIWHLLHHIQFHHSKKLCSVSWQEYQTVV